MDNRALTATTVSILQALIVVAFVSLICFIVNYKWKRRHLVKLAAQLPGPPTLPIIGNALMCRGNPEDMVPNFIALYNIYRPTFRLWLGPALIVVVSKPEDVQIIFNNRSSLDKGYFYKFLGTVLGNGLVTAPVEKWRKHKRLITPAFNMKLLEQFIPIFCKHNMIMVSKLKQHVNNGQFDISNYSGTNTMNLICDTAFGIDEKTPSEFKSEFIEAFNRVIDIVITRTYKIWLHPDFIFYLTSYGAETIKCTKKYTCFINKIIEEKKRKYKLKKEREFEQHKDADIKLKVFVDILLELSESGANFSDDELRDEVVTMIAAGYDTTGQAVCFCVLLLAMHQDIQEKLYKEIFEIFGDSDREVTMDDLKKMTYMEKVIKETLRRYAIVPVVLREIKEDIKLTDCTLPAGCTALISPYLIHMNPDNFRDPEKFNPENFTPERIAERHTCCFIPFALGPRTCVGQVYAMLSMKTTVAYLIRNYKFFTDIKMEDIKLKMDTLLRNTNGYPVRIVTRKK